MNVTTGDIFAGVFVVALVYLLVRPGSRGAATIDAITGAAVALVKRATS